MASLPFRIYVGRGGGFVHEQPEFRFSRKARSRSADDAALAATGPSSAAHWRLNRLRRFPTSISSRRLGDLA